MVSNFIRNWPALMLIVVSISGCTSLQQGDFAIDVIKGAVEHAEGKYDPRPPIYSENRADISSKNIKIDSDDVEFGLFSGIMRGVFDLFD